VAAEIRCAASAGAQAASWDAPSEFSRKYVDTMVTQDVVSVRMTYTANMKPNT
jgi:hypothetical protein